MYPFRKCRETAGLTQKYVAVSLNVKPPSVVEWEKGKSNPTIENLIKLSMLYKMSVDTLLGLDAITPTSAAEIQYNQNEKKLLGLTQRLNSLGVQKVIEYANDLAANDKYTQEASTSSVG